jgi:hypothetical protein
MTVGGILIDPQTLLPKDKLLEYLRENGESDRALAHIRVQHQNSFGNELVWHYPISDGKHLGTFIVAVREGFVSLPYDAADREDYELLELDDAAMFDADDMQTFIDDWRTYSDDLLSAMTDMLRILRGEQ